MAEFREVMRQKKRMCNSVLCCKCDIYRLCGADLSKCQQFINNNPKKAEEVIMSWAAKHPEPVYPTWVEYLVGIGVIPHEIRLETADTLMDTHLLKPIRADIAEKLGIEPKEV